MAGAFTHWMIAKTALGELSPALADAEEAQTRLPFVLLGAVSPDLPYLCVTDDADLWADRMHYEKTGEFVRVAAGAVSQIADAADRAAALAWLLGYASHLVADTVVHPVVNAIVGPYRFNQFDHRLCETTQDSLIFKEVEGKEIVKTAFQTQLMEATGGARPGLNSRSVHKAVKQVWLYTLKKLFPAKRGVNMRIHEQSMACDSWLKAYVGRMGLAAGPNAFGRNLTELAGIAYRASGKIGREARTRFYDTIPLPDGTTGSFKTAVFDKAVQDTIRVWNNLLGDIEKERTDAIIGYVKNWDLDLGVDLERPDLWS
jgi:hypothetical protein